MYAIRILSVYPDFLQDSEFIVNVPSQIDNAANARHLITRRNEFDPGQRLINKVYHILLLSVSETKDGRKSITKTKDRWKMCKRLSTPSNEGENAAKTKDE